MYTADNNGILLSLTVPDSLYLKYKTNRTKYFTERMVAVI